MSRNQASQKTGLAAVRLFPSRFCRNAYQPISRGTGTSHLRRDPFRSRLLLSAYNAPLLPARTVTRPLCVTHREIKFDRGERGGDPPRSAKFHLPFTIFLKGMILPVIFYAERYKRGRFEKFFRRLKGKIDRSWWIFHEISMWNMYIFQNVERRRKFTKIEVVREIFSMINGKNWLVISQNNHIWNNY